ncbi:MAG: hypothetical protein CMN77_10465 [Spirochaetaceae bacterium]|nr:hypothetical protein [Spirochaetaceae bacterium]|tara:strand:+ start:52929 stop:53876 length:948 start_codon:yes stop_codon:yes gene_type:complete
MKAIQYSKFGGPDVLQWTELKESTPGPDQVAIRVKAAGVNPVDWKLRSGSIPFSFLFRLKLPFVPGAEVSGIVAETGKNVTSFKPGDEVIGYHSALEGGGYAERILMKASCCQPRPSNVSFEEGAGAPLAALTAYQLMKGLVKEDSRVLVLGGSGGVGHFGIQIARAMGARVTAVASSRNLQFLADLGASEGFAYDDSDYPGQLKNYDIVLDAVARSNPAELSGRIERRGAFLSTLPNPVHFAEAALRGIHYRGAMVESRPEDMRKLMAWLASGEVRTHIDSTFPMDQAKEAHRKSEEGHAKGKIVLVNPSAAQG